MKKTVSPFRLFAATGLAVMLGHAVAFAQTAPKREQLPNVDKRLAAGNRSQLSDAKAEALAGLQKSIPGIQADVDPLLKTPAYISSTRGFLTGPNGAGISPDATKAFADNDPHRTVKGFLNQHASLFGHGADVLDGAKINREFSSAHNGLTTTVWQQQLDGIPLFKTVMIGHVTKKGELVNLATHFLPDAAKAADAGMPNRLATRNAPTISAAAAIVSAAQDVGHMLSLDQIKKISAAKDANQQQRFNAAPVLNGETVAELVWLPMNESNLRLAWQVLFTSRERGEMYLSVVDAQTGEVIVRHGLTEYISDATYNVYTSDSPSPFSPGHPTPSALQPALIPRVLVTTSAISPVASPNGWINDGNQETLGNNVDAHLDRNDDNSADLPRPDGGTTRSFDFPLDLNQGPATYGDAAVVNLFYWNNLFHDKLYDLGFTEAAGNFQTDNFGRGGIGGDPLLADAQDGLDLPDPFHDNNANMATPPDGFSPRMQMYKFSGPNPDRDGDLDAEVILHEHAHGLSNRRVGGGVGLFNLQSRGMGEGWSDFYGLTLLAESSDDINATYAVGGYLTLDFFGLTENYYFGIRRYPYSTDMTKNPLTFKDIDPGQASSHPGIPMSPISVGTPADQVHAQGEVWCVTLWEARAALINKHGFAVGNQLILQLVTDGMNLSPANPTFLQARDGILLADQVLTGGANQDQLWAAFAKRGMGALAGSPASTTTAGVIESFDVPGLAYNSTSLTGGNGNGIIDFNECNNLLITLTNIGVGASNITVTLTTTSPEVIVAQAFSLYPNISGGGSGNNFTPFKISTSPSFLCGTEIELALVIKSDIDTRTNFFRLPSGVTGSPVRFDNNTPVFIPDNNPEGATSPIVVSNFNGTIGKVTVSLHIPHTFTFDLQLQLISPDGTTVTLSQNNGGAGDNYGTGCSPETSRTRFDESATVAISAGNPPFVGAFQPDQPLSNFNLKSGTNVNGIWQLKVVDQIGIDLGTIQCWSLFLSPQSCVDGGGECPGSDLAATMIATPGPVVTSSNLTYTITVTNHGPSTAKAVVLSQVLPSSVVFVSSTNSQGTAQHSGGIVTCNFGQIPARRSATATVIVIPTAPGTISSTATVGSNQSDPNPANNSVTVLTRVVPPSADLSVTILDSPDPVSVGGNLTYTVVVTNRGPTTAFNVRLTNALPNTAEIVSASSTQGSVVSLNNPVVFNLGNLVNGAGTIVTILVRPNQVGSITATSTVISDQADLFPGNNSASATTTVTPAADLALSIVDNPDPAIVGSNITYTITLTNRGPNNVTSVAINGTLPSSALFVTSSIPLTLNGNTFSVTTNGIVSGNSLVFSIVLQAPIFPEELTLSATASASQADPNIANNSASAVTTVAFASAVFAADGSTLITENISPANGSVDAGETVDVALRLRNVGNIPTTNLVATLLSGNGVSAPSASQSYGVLTNGSDSVSRTFRFTANGTNGQTITATLRLQDGSGPVTNVNFAFDLPTTRHFANTNLITISNVGPADPYPAQIVVSGVTGLVDKVTVSLNKLNHSYPDDIDMLLVDPTGRKILLMSDAGGENLLTNVILTLDSAATSAVADSDQLVSGSFRPADYTDGAADFFTNAPAGPYGTSLDTFDGTAPNGTWSLYIVDDTSGDKGTISGGWSLAITTIKPVNKIADLTLAVTAASASLVNESISYTFVVTNNGPDTASNVTLNNPLPPNSSALSVTFTNIGDLLPGSNATVVVTLTPTTAGSFTNTASVSSSASIIDLNTNNNFASAITAVGLPVANLGIALSAAPTSIAGSNLVYTITVTNSGPDTAYGIVVTNRLPATAAYVSADTAVSVAGGVVTCGLGNLSAGSSVSFSITATTLVAGNITNTANVITSSSDQTSGNNSASVTTIVSNPTPNLIASGANLDAENLVANAAVDPNETVTISLALANNGSASTANLVATLQATGGVTSPSGPQNYGAVVNGGAAVSRAFTFTASGAIGGSIVATLQLQDGANNFGSVTFTFALPQLGSFANAAAISIPNSGPATPYPSTITVSGVTGLVSKVTVALKGVTHSFPDDLDILLLSPSGQQMLLLSDVGGARGINSVNLNFDQTGVALPDTAQIVSGTFRPTDFETGDFIAPPAPGGPYANSFTTFNGGTPNGDWSLFVNDDTGADFGNISGGWTLQLTTVSPINNDIVLSASVVNGECHLILTAQSGLSYRIEASSDLANWTAISTNVAINGVCNVIDSDAPNFNPRFYRAVLVP